MSAEGQSQERGAPLYPLRKWWCQDVGPRPWYRPAPLFMPYISGPVLQPSRDGEGHFKWKVELDVGHFAPAEVSLSIKSGLLEVRGQHEERPDEHGSIARCFTRKYRLPSEIDVVTVVSSLSVDGILTVEAPISKASVPAAVVIPIKVEVQEHKEQSVFRADSSEARESPSVEESPADVPVQQGSVPAEHQQCAEKMNQQEEEEGGEPRPAAESPPPAPADGAGSASDQDSSGNREAAVDQVAESSGGAEGDQAEESQVDQSPPSEDLVQHLQDPDLIQ